MKKLDFDFYYRQLKEGVNIDETCFYFDDDKEEVEHYIGYIPDCEKPYWVGLCDIEGGCEFDTADELMQARIYDGKSLVEKWSNVVICHIEGLNVEDWLECMKHC